MTTTHEFHPDLNDCVLEGRELPAVFVPNTPWLLITANVGGGSNGPGGGISSISNLPPLPGPTPISYSIGAGSVGSSGGLTTVGGSLFGFYGRGYGVATTGPAGGAAVGS